MFVIPLPFVITEIVIFVMAVKSWGFFSTLGLYLLPCLLGFFIVTTVGRVAVMTLQATVMKGQLPAGRILHSGAIFLSGLLFLIPSFFARVLALVLFLPGLRHLVVWRFKLFMAKKLAKGGGSFSFGAGGPFGFGTRASSGFRYYEFRQEGQGMYEASQEREVREANVLDVTPLEITHHEKNKQDEEPK